MPFAQLYAIFLLTEKSGSSCQHSKELQTSKSINVQARFIGCTFSWKRMGLAQIRVRGKSLGDKSKGDKSKGGKRKG